MGFWSGVRAALGIEQRNGGPPRYGSLDLFRDILNGGRMAKSGVSVTSDTAMQVTAVLGAARVLAEDVSGLPLNVLRRDGKTRTALPDDPLQALLDAPNGWQTGMEFREQMMLHAVLCGRGLAWKNVVRGEVRELLPLLPGWVTTEQRKDWGVFHKVRLPDGTTFTLRADEVFHLRGPSWDGFNGMEVVRLAREAIGLALATEGAHARLHANGLQTSGLYSVDGVVNAEDYPRLRAHVEAHQSGPENQFKPFILDRNAKFTPVSMTGVDAQHLETRKNQIEEIARAMRVFPQMIGYSDKTSTFASAEAFFLAHVKYSLLPWIRRWEGVIGRDLIGRRAGVYVKHNVAGLERADIKTRYTAYGQGIKDGWLLRNEARGWEDLDEIEGLSEPLQPLNMATPDQAAADQGDESTGGGPTKGRRPFADDVRAFKPGQARGPDGRWSSSGARPRQIKRFLNRTRRRRRSGRVAQHLLGDVTATNAAAVRAATGIDTAGMKRTMDSQELLHAFRQHGNRAREAGRKQVAITAADVGRVPRIVAAATTIARGKGSASGPTIAYTARLGRFEYTYVEQVRRTQGTVSLKTLWKRRT